MTAWKFGLLAALLVAIPVLDQQAASSAHYVGPQAKSADASKPPVPVDRRPSDGAINGHSYTSNFFHFSLTFPEGWKVIAIGNGVDPRVDPTGATGYVLLVVGTADKQHHTRWIAIGALRPSAGPSALSSEVAAKYAAMAIKLFGGGENVHLTMEPTKIQLGNRDMTRFDHTDPVTIQGTKYDTQVTNLWTVERGHLLMFISSDPVGNESNDGSAAKALNSLNFFEKTK